MAPCGALGDAAGEQPLVADQDGDVAVGGEEALGGGPVAGGNP